MKVLIADDSATWRRLLEGNLRNWGFEPVVAEDGAQAWQILQRKDAPRLVILDWQMPELDGIDVCRNIKYSEGRPFTYVLMLTGRNSQEDIVEGLDAGADDYLTKPVQVPILRSRLMAAKRIVEVVPPQEWSVPRVPGYDVKQVLGKGAFATVWEAVQESTGRTVALKVIRVDLATKEVFGRFSREVQMMQKMDHPNIARVYDSRVDRELGYCAMELVDGFTLERYTLEQEPKPGRILLLMAQICDALEYAHQQGVVHRDLTPSNIMLTRDIQPKLVDFGLGKWMFHPDADEETGHTLDGYVIGSPMFMAPEQARGENEKLDGRADIYALGIIVYMLLVRRHPHDVNEQSRWETIRAVADGQVRQPSEVRRDFNRDLEHIIMKALADKPEKRHQSAAEFGSQLRRFVRKRLQMKKKRTG